MDLPSEFTVALAKPLVLRGLELFVLTFRKSGEGYELVLPEVPDEMAITLRKPVSVPGGEPMAALSLREPTAGELKKATAQGDQMQQAIMLIAMISGQAPPLIEALTARDFKRAAEYLANFT